MPKVFVAEDVAAWMLSEVRAKRYLDQEDIVWKIQKKFGTNFTYDNDYGNLAVDKKVLRIFKKISSDEIVWSRSDKQWRIRERGDAPGRQQE